ncbi:MAG: hypothetical protein V8R83_08965 [Candidatus Gastranaerophilaceae bacterium]|jgi:hypothetical protein|nr:unknown [Clostridium sp. CAG:306]
MADTTTIQIRPTETGWILSKKGKDGKDVTLEIADKDKNGLLDIGTDVEIGKNQNIFTDEEIQASSDYIFSVKNGKAPVDGFDEKSQELEEEIAAKYNEQQREQRLQQALHGNTDYKGATKSAKRNNLWSKINMGMMIGAGALNTVMPFLFRPWQYNGGNLWDMQGVLFSSMTNLMSSANTIMMAQYANKANQYIQSPQTSGNYKTLNPSNISVQDFMNSVEIYNKQQQEQAEKYKQEKEAAQVKQEAERTAAFAKSIYTKANEEGAVIDDSNKAKLNDIYKTYKKPEEYTQEEKEIMQTIGAYPQIPYNAVAKDDEESGKLTKELASQIDNLLKLYETESESNNLAKSDYEYLKSYIINKKAAQGTLTKMDLENLDIVIKRSQPKNI